jgi:hypothetical protein
MKLKYEFALSEMAGEIVAVSVGAGDRNMVIGLNSTARFMWEMLANGTDVDTMAAALMDKYDGLDEETARAETEEFVQQLRDKGLLDK